MGEVYRAHDARLGREVAVKILPAERLSDPVRRARFVQEVQAASRLSHPHIVTIYEIGASDGIDYIAMEYVAGQALDTLIPKQGMRLGEALRVAIPIADALAAAHARGIVHGDLKPANVVVSGDGVVKVLDFGLAKLVGDDASDSHDTLTTATAALALSRAGVIAGTAAYMSPEQATAGKVDARSDVFSFGAVLYEMVTGRRPFAGQSMSETLAAVVRDQPKPPSALVPGIPDPLERLILRCLRKESGKRFQHMADVKVELEEIKEDSDSAAAAPAARPASPRRTAGLAAAVGLAVIAASIGAWLWWSRTPSPPPRVVPLTALPGWEGPATFSPDGQHVAFVWGGDKGDNDDIYVKLIGSSELQRLTTDPARDGGPAWSPDGRRIAFVRESTGRNAIHLVSSLGGPDRKLSDLPARFRVSWSPDGRWLAAAR